MKKFVVKRDSVWAGLLVNSDSSSSRPIIYYQKDDKALDLRYDGCSEYSISFDDLQVIGSINLDTVLEKLGYRDNLTQRDLNRVYSKLLINDKWLKKNKYLFGFVDLMNGGYAMGESSILDPKLYYGFNLIHSYTSKEPIYDEPNFQNIKKRK